MRRPSLSLGIYMGVTAFADGWAERKLARRLDLGKEDKDRIGERTGKAGVARPDGPLVWFHAASVGESMSLLELLRRVREEYPSLNVLITTGTKTSASLLNVRLPEGVIHQFAPVDAGGAVARFLAHWKPDVAVWTESEFWPRLMSRTHASGARMVLINGRISESTRDRWRWFRAMSLKLLGFFDLLLVQDETAEAHFRAIGAPVDRMKVTGSLKEGAVPLPDNAVERSKITKAIGARPVWLAASTHEGEEEVVAEAHKAAARHMPELLLLLAPRHPERGDEVEKQLRDQGFAVARRSRGEGVVAETDVFLCDTLGELGMLYRVAPLSFVGGSLAPVGGHNPFEPAALGSAIVHGPHVSNFSDIYKRLAARAATLEVADAEALARAVIEGMRPDRAAELAAAAWEVSSDGAGVTDRVLDHLDPYLAPLIKA